MLAALGKPAAAREGRRVIVDDSTLLVTTTLCDASRQTDGRIFGLLDYCTIWDGHARVGACHAAGSENDQVRKFWQADPAPQDEDSTRPEDQGQGSEEQQHLIGVLDSGPAVVLVTLRSNVSGARAGRWEGGRSGIGFA